MFAARKLSGWYLVYAAFVVYGSLVPLDFRELPLADAWARFQRIPFLQLGVDSRADWIANGVLYAPLGFLATAALRRLGWGRLGAPLVAVLLGGALALAVEFAQLFFPPRTVSLNDLMAEGIGTGLGAVAALLVGRHRAAFGQLRHAGRDWADAHAFGLYLAAYLAYCLFPYDLLISAGELQDKLASMLWGWWLAGDGSRPLVRLVRLGVEVALTAPLGWLWARRAAPVPTLGRALLIGLLLGLGIEMAQLLVASGVSQGASVLARGLGMALGLVAWRARAHWPLTAVRDALARRRLWILAAYLPLLLAVNGWFAGPWRDAGEVAAVWSDLRFLPFYYHYYTTEAQALISLTSVTLMYLPVGALVWARRRSAARAALWAAGLCLAVEASKLWLAGLHPDPTNPWIAAVAAAALVLVADRRPGRASAAVPGMAAGGAARGPAAAALVVALGLLALHAASAPAFAVGTTVGLLLCAALVWHRPVALVWLVPALLPLLDLAPWTGRFVWDEFDLLLALGLAVAYWRTPTTPGVPAAAEPWRGLWRAAFALLALSYGVSAVIGALPLAWPDANSWATYAGAPNVLRIVKGLAWAALFIGLLTRLEQAGHDSGRALAGGTAFGLAGVVAVVLWERASFVGLLDLQADYRVTGPFSAMHRGGAFIECYLAVAAPLAAAAWLDARRLPTRLAAVLLLAGAGYATAVTFSRNGYVAFGAALGLFLLLAAWRGAHRPRHGGWRRALTPLAAGAAALALALPVLLGSFAQQRLAAWQRDLAVRQAHWADALAIRDDGLVTALFGMGIGRFPETHFWRSHEPARAASFRVVADRGQAFLRLGGGAPTFIDQFVSPGAAQPHRLSLRLRANQPGARLAFSVCRKWMLTSAECVQGAFQSSGEVGAWTRHDVELDLTPLAGAGPGPQPVKLALHTPAEGVVLDVDDVSLRDGDSRELVINGGFEQGLDRWFFSTDVDPPWHIHSLPLTVLFDQGAFGLLAWALLLGTALVGGARRAWAGHRLAAAAWAALIGFLASGLLNTLIDEPRFLFLLLVLTWLCVAGRPVASALRGKDRAPG